MSGKYRTIVADPPWDYAGKTPPWRSTSLPAYELMPLDKICALPVGELASGDAHLYLWAVLPMMREAYEVVEAWGFTPETLLTWCKPGPGLGGGWRGNTEHVIVARRGWSAVNPTCDKCGGRARGARKCGCDEPAWRVKGKLLDESDVQRQPFAGVADGTWYTAPRQEHSKKPELFLDLIESMSRPPRLELFARRRRLGWDVWGNEVESDVDLLCEKVTGHPLSTSAHTRRRLFKHDFHKSCFRAKWQRLGLSVARRPRAGCYTPQQGDCPQRGGKW
jgi:N6-adenosine-specific RNA methylase IME4